MCRDMFPGDPVTETHYAEGGIQLWKPVGCEYMNEFNSIVMRTLRCNHYFRVRLVGLVW